MPQGFAHVFKIVMFTACANTFLTRCSPYIVSLFNTEEKIFELHHTGIYEE